MPPLSQLLRAIRHPFGDKPEAPAEPLCPVCKSRCPPLDSVDFNKNCEEARGLKLPTSGERVEYRLCDACGFCFAPQFARWSFRDFEERIYNDGYEAVDPDYKRIRPEANASLLEQLFGAAKPKHLDYGGGSGVLSAALRDRGWDSRTYDPFVDRELRVRELGRFDLVTAFEVFEHVPDIEVLFADLQALVEPDGLVVFSTLLSDGEIVRGRPLRWWYAAPRNGHISLFSGQSLRLCLNQRGFNLASANANLHLAYRSVPAWARHLLPAA
jgi:hypothetical protein